MHQLLVLCPGGKLQRIQQKNLLLFGVGVRGGVGRLWVSHLKVGAFTEMHRYVITPAR